MICAQTILVATVVDCNFDADTGIYQADNGRWDSNEIGVAAVSSACEPSNIGNESSSDNKDGFLRSKTY